MRLRKFICDDCLALLSKNKPPRPTAVQPVRRQQRHASTTTENRSLRVGIIGSGPAGFYTALRILLKMPDAKVDMFEQLPAPFGLVRYGVAPDHPEVKNCQERFDEVAQSPQFRFIGNVEVGKDISLETLKAHYDALLFAYGAAQDKTLGVPGEHLKGVLSARAFVGWYNGLPEYDNLNPDLTTGENAVVIGNGNVALDVARVLLSGVDHLRKTDISEQALDAISRSKIKHVMVCGRRGPMQAAFTIKEVRELFNIPGLGFVPIDRHLLPTSEWISVLPRLEQRKYRLANLLAKGSKTDMDGAEKTWSLTSLLSPQSFEARAETKELGGITFVKNVYDGDDKRFEHDAKTAAAGDTEFVPASMAFRSIGYKSVPIHGLQEELGIPFDTRRGIIPNDGTGRILSDGDTSDKTRQIPGCYCAGWVKRGPTGVIASTMEDAFVSADVVMLDWNNGSQFLNGSTKTDPHGAGNGWDGVLHDLPTSQRQSLRPVDWRQWKHIDAAEISRGRIQGKPREKFRSPAEMLQVLD